MKEDPGDSCVVGHSLFGWPSTRQHTASDPGIEVLGIPCDFGNGIASGARFGPESIRRASLTLPPPGIEGVDLGDADFAQHCDWADVIVRIREAVEEMAGRKARPLVLGGDHSVSYAIVAGLRALGPLSIVWFDAHTDFCPWPLRAQCHNHKQVLRRISSLDHVGRILQIGHRGMTYIDESQLSERMEIVTAGAAGQLQATPLLEFLPADQPVYISVDIDAVDPRWAPGTGHPVPGGLSVASLSRLARTAIANRDVVGIDLVEVNPLLDRDHATSVVAARIVREMVSAFHTRNRAPEAASVGAVSGIAPAGTR